MGRHGVQATARSEDGERELMFDDEGRGGGVRGWRAWSPTALGPSSHSGVPPPCMRYRRTERSAVGGWEYPQDSPFHGRPFMISLAAICIASSVVLSSDAMCCQSRRMAISCFSILVQTTVSFATVVAGSTIMSRSTTAPTTATNISGSTAHETRSTRDAIAPMPDKASTARSAFLQRTYRPCKASKYLETRAISRRSSQT